MFGDAIRCTHNGTGGSGTLTLASVSGWPQPSDVFGASGTRIIYYQINEFTDSTFATLAQYERGVGSLNLSTGVLTRYPQVTWASSVYLVGASLTKLNIGSSAANVQILLSASAATQGTNLPGVAQPVGSGFSGGITGYRHFNTRQTFDSSVGGMGPGNGTRNWIPIEFADMGPINNVYIYCTTANAGAALRVGLYDWDTDNLPGNLIEEFTSSSQIALTATGMAGVAVPTIIAPPPGWYFLCLQANDGTAQISTANVNGSCGLGFGTGRRDVIYYNKGATYGALPATGDKTASNLVSRSSGSPPWVGFS